MSLRRNLPPPDNQPNLFDLLEAEPQVEGEIAEILEEARERERYQKRVRDDIWYPNDEEKAKEKAYLDCFRHAGMENEVSFHATGGMPGIGILDNAKRHRNNFYFYKTDIVKAYPSVDRNILTAMLAVKFDKYFADEWFNYHEEIWRGQTSGLALGAHSSPLLFNWYCKRLDHSLAELTASLHKDAVYTRYIDDITISLPESYGEHISAADRKRVRGILSYHDFDDSIKKTHLHSLSKGPVTITGISLYPNGRLAYKPEIINNARLAVEAVEVDDPELKAMRRVMGYYVLLLGLKDEKMTPAVAAILGRIKHADERFTFPPSAK